MPVGVSGQFNSSRSPSLSGSSSSSSTSFAGGGGGGVDVRDTDGDGGSDGGFRIFCQASYGNNVLFDQQQQQSINQ